jgi:hypothetical protein
MTLIYSRILEALWDCAEAVRPIDRRSLCCQRKISFIGIGARKISNMGLASLINIVVILLSD